MMNYIFDVVYAKVKPYMTQWEQAGDIIDAALSWSAPHLKSWNYYPEQMLLVDSESKVVCFGLNCCEVFVSTVEMQSDLMFIHNTDGKLSTSSSLRSISRFGPSSSHTTMLWDSSSGPSPSRIFSYYSYYYVFIKLIVACMCLIFCNINRVGSQLAQLWSFQFCSTFG